MATTQRCFRYEYKSPAIIKFPGRKQIQLLNSLASQNPKIERFVEPN